MWTQATERLLKIHLFEQKNIKLYRIDLYSDLISATVTRKLSLSFFWAPLSDTNMPIDTMIDGVYDTEDCYEYRNWHEFYFSFSEFVVVEFIRFLTPNDLSCMFIFLISKH